MLQISLFSAVWCLVLVNAYPLIPSIQPCPALNYQQNIYRPPYSEALILQPSNNNPYAQQVLIQPPPTPYQSSQIPSLLEQITQIYWDKLLSNPSLRDLLDPNKILQNQYGKDIQTNLHPYNAGGVVNNYIIIPPDYLKDNGTVSRSTKAKRGGNKLSNPVKESVNLNQRKKKVPDNNLVTTQNTSNIKKSPKGKQKVEKSWNFSTDNIKCFTPADVLENEKYQPKNKKSKNNEDTKQCRKECGNRNKKSNTQSEIQKPRKTKNNKVKKKSRETIVNEGKEKTVENISSLTTTDKKIRQRKNELQECKCVKKDELADCETKIGKNYPQSCKQDMNDFLLSNLLQQGCTDLENRRTRNSKTEAAKKDFRNVYPDFSDDISKSMSWYMNDVFSPHSLQLAPNNFLLGNNMYPFDLSQIYQIPQYSHDINKSNGNTGKNHNTKRRKKKKKKNSKPKTVIENSSNNNDSNYSQISETSIQIPETIKEIPETSGQSPETSTRIPATISQIPETNTEAPEINTQISESNILIKTETTIENTSIINEIMPVETTPADKVLEYFGEPNKNIENIKFLEEKFDKLQEMYKTQVPESVDVRKMNNNYSEILEKKEKDIKEIPFDFQTFNLVPEFQSEDDIFNIFDNVFMEDYYPDFKADNHAYLVNEEEIDIRNIHDRYFYTTDKNIDSREIYLTENINQHSNKEVIYTEDELRNEIEHKNNKYSPQEEDKSQEVVFRTPPGLEAPDFITRKINRDRQDSNEIYYQHNDHMLHNYDADFDRYNLDSFADKTDNYMKTVDRHSTNENKPGSLVETVYARSKVVKYGQGQEFNKPIRPKVENIFPKAEDMSIKNYGDKTIVTAKSLGPEEFW